MSHPTVEYTGTLSVFHQLFLIADEDGAELGPETEIDTNGLVAIDDLGIRVRTSAGVNQVGVTAEVYDDEPPVDPRIWDDVVEFPVHVPVGSLQLSVMLSGTAADGFPVLSAQGRGDYRLRVHVRGRDARHWERPDEVLEFYLVQSWPAAPRPLTVLKRTDETGARVRTVPGTDDVTAPVRERTYKPVPIPGEPGGIEWVLDDGEETPGI